MNSCSGVIDLLVESWHLLAELVVFILVAVQDHAAAQFAFCVRHVEQSLAGLLMDVD